MTVGAIRGVTGPITKTVSALPYRSSGLGLDETDEKLPLVQRSCPASIMAAAPKDGLHELLRAGPLESSAASRAASFGTNSHVPW